jgi:hypothetical protein
LNSRHFSAIEMAKLNVSSNWLFRVMIIVSADQVL